jgi:hypothetical protein
LQEKAGGVTPAGFFSGIEHFLPKVCPMPKLTNHIKREVRRARRLWAWIRVHDRTIAECHVMDISNGGAKIATTTPSLVPNRFELAFAEGGQTRSCEVIWRHGKIFGVKFAG